MNDWLNLDFLQQHSLDMRQFIDFRGSTLPNGMRVFDAHNSSGLTFSVLPDRGMDIWSANYKGIPLTWIAPGSPHFPDYGHNWLGLFNGGLLTTCGLTHVGPPEDDRDLHGNFTRCRATEISTDRQTDRIQLNAHIYQSSLFGEQFEVIRTFTLRLGIPEIHIHDKVMNIGDQSSPFMLLYHCNVGYPMVREHTELLVNSKVFPRDDIARTGIDRWHVYEAATQGYAEQVFFHHLQDTSTKIAEAALLNENLGLKFSWDTHTLPYLTQWKNTRQGIYVSGIEPGNCIPEGQNAARASGRLHLLEPGEQQEFDLWITVIEGKNSVYHYREAMEAARRNATPLEGIQLTDYEAGDWNTK